VRVGVVVAAAIVRDGLLLAQQRARPAELAGRWELPGGLAERGEPDDAALIRECGEELGVLVRPGARLGPDVTLPGGRVLRAYAATLATRRGATGRDGRVEPRAVEHAALRWVSAEQLDELDWLEADRVLLPALHELLGGQANGVRRPGPGGRRA